jgi:uncharacterized protein involved in exopolysaccharide biosynthesis
MRQQLYELEIRERELLSKFTADHPAVAALREQVREAKAILDRQPSQRTETKNALNPTRQPLEVALLNEQANLASSRAKAEKLHAQRELAIGKLKALNESELRLASLQRVADVAAANYRTYSEKLEQARIDQALENQRISNVNVAQPATFVEKPVSPRKGLALMLALIVGAAGALGVALAAEHLDHSLKTPEEVEQRLDLPVLVSVPRIVRNPVLMN